MKIEFRSKGPDAINISNILNQKDVKAAIPLYFKNHISPLIPFSYMPPIATKIFNWRDVLRLVDTEYDIGDPVAPVPLLLLTSGSNYHVLLSTDRKYREPKSFSWKKNSTLIMDSVEK